MVQDCGDGCTACHEKAGSIMCDTCTTVAYAQNKAAAGTPCVGECYDILHRL